MVLVCQHMCVQQDQRHQTDVGSDPLFMRGMEKEVDADENRGRGGGVSTARNSAITQHLDF